MISAIVTDIEGTTSSLSFVKDVLFPYARAHLEDYVRSHLDDAKVQQLLIDVGAVVGETLSLEQSIAQLIQWLDDDQKITPLKALQGLIWRAGYDKGDFTGHLYDDAVQQLQAWHTLGLALYVYSSGSVQAQKLLFAHTDYGDLTPLFSDYFDTNIGGKRDSASYTRIAEQIGSAAQNILFLSDSEDELNAAQSAGLQTIWLVRDAPLNANAPHLQVASFATIALP